MYFTLIFSIYFSLELISAECCPDGSLEDGTTSSDQFHSVKIVISSALGLILCFLYILKLNIVLRL